MERRTLNQFFQVLPEDVDLTFPTQIMDYSGQRKGSLFRSDKQLVGKIQ